MIAHDGDDGPGRLQGSPRPLSMSGQHGASGRGSERRKARNALKGKHDGRSRDQCGRLCSLISVGRPVKERGQDAYDAVHERGHAGQGYLQRPIFRIGAALSTKRPLYILKKEGLKKMPRLQVMTVAGAGSPDPVVEELEESRGSTPGTVHQGHPGRKYRYFVLLLMFGACLTGISVTAMTGYFLLRHLR